MTEPLKVLQGDHSLLHVPLSALMPAGGFVIEFWDTENPLDPACFRFWTRRRRTARRAMRSSCEGMLIIRSEKEGGLFCELDENTHIDMFENFQCRGCKCWGHSRDSIGDYHHCTLCKEKDELVSPLHSSKRRSHIIPSEFEAMIAAEEGNLPDVEVSTKVH